ncbi:MULTISPECIES: DUF3631 domain-containing protein [unclassified Streptomyces]|uniref:DUF3631 domain-containing protein n=1 Tax=unclassified Streptomyces TaxID=2593676 RepID=UPI000DC7B459|nr:MULTISPECIES: DUF3631 domain-containing protein [unclassified Streptomyces]AWZ08358.1 hypothetical protein DRB89_31475 [Streptomyces sp. ICC4]AWZ16128.1 hypothetical protein DRB96_32170 [Streptomyces sp. ICC1]
MPFPNFLDSFAINLLGATPLEANPRHRAILDAYTDVQNLDRRLLTDIATAIEAGKGTAQQLEACIDALAERFIAGYQLSLLLSTDCCCAEDAAEAEPCVPCGLERDEECCQDPERPGDLLEACLGVFAQLGDPYAVASADLVDALRDLPGIAGKHWRYSDLTQARLAELLAPHGLRTRDITLPDGRRRKSYQLDALFTSMGVCTSC